MPLRSNVERDGLGGGVGVGNGLVVLGVRARFVEPAETLHQLQTLANAGVDLCFGDDPRFEQRLHFLRRVTDGAGHLEVETCGERLRRGIDRTPIGHHEPLVAPLVAQNALDEVVVFRTVLLVNAIVSRHQTTRVALLDGDFEGSEIHLVQGAFVDVGAGEVAVVLAVVGGEMLHGRRHIPRLHTANVSR
jgi:hypothetical protein